MYLEILIYLQCSFRELNIWSVLVILCQDSSVAPGMVMPVTLSVVPEIHSHPGRGYPPLIQGVSSVLNQLFTF